jgi:hypothetical protein
LRNLAAFQDVANAVHRVLTAAQALAVASEPDSWLYQFVEYCEATDASAWIHG